MFLNVSGTEAKLVDLGLPFYSSLKIGTIIVLSQSLGNSFVFHMFLKTITNDLPILSVF